MKTLWIVAMAVTTGFTPAALAGQGAPPPTQGGQQVRADTAVVELVLRREAFTYPAFARRNPFRPLASADDTGPRFDQMRVQLILFNEADPSRSIAVLTAGGGRGGASGPGQGTAGRGQVQRLSVGERWGNVRVVSIERTRVIVDVSEFGIEDRRIMTIQSRSQGGS
ncbi:MAG: hypothetical protein RQ745_01735 [Longimicrobiales bacterium]|nr:hypothetical protein [Longimicrobiales bacterium]